MVDEKIMFIGVIWVVLGEGRGNIPIRKVSLNIPTRRFHTPWNIHL
jgi:hypothetical protein